MIRPSLRLYLTANALVYLIVAFWMLPEGFLIGFFAVLFSAVYSLPSLLLLAAFFYTLQIRRPNLRLCWIFLCTVAAGCSFLPLFLLGFEFGELTGEWPLLITASVGGGFGSLAIQSQSIQRYFKKLQTKPLQHENN